MGDLVDIKVNAAVQKVGSTHLSRLEGGRGQRTLERQSNSSLSCCAPGYALQGVPRTHRQGLECDKACSRCGGQQAGESFQHPSSSMTCTADFLMAVNGVGVVMSYGVTMRLLQQNLRISHCCKVVLLNSSVFLEMKQESVEAKASMAVAQIMPQHRQGFGRQDCDGGRIRTSWEAHAAA